ncbi:MAG: hypothetical protein SchgKO_22800 [Schleiferiaceae bacterium]
MFWADEAIDKVRMKQVQIAVILEIILLSLVYYKVGNKIGTQTLRFSSNSQWFFENCEF